MANASRCWRNGSIKRDTASREPDLPEEMARVFRSRPELRERWQAVLLAASRQTVLGDFLACGSFDVRPRLGELNVPTLLVGGTEPECDELEWIDRDAICDFDP